jgi:hypothetical protein
MLYLLLVPYVYDHSLSRAVSDPLLVTPTIRPQPMVAAPAGGGQQHNSQVINEVVGPLAERE